MVSSESAEFERLLQDARSLVHGQPIRNKGKELAAFSAGRHFPGKPDAVGSECLDCLRWQVLRATQQSADRHRRVHAGRDLQGVPVAAGSLWLRSVLDQLDQCLQVLIREIDVPNR